MGKRNDGAGPEYVHLDHAVGSLRDAVRELSNAAGAYSPGEAKRIAYDAAHDEAERMLRTVTDYRDNC